MPESHTEPRTPPVRCHRTQDRAHKRKNCIDCTDEGITTNRKAPHPGPRCTTHHRAKRTSRKAGAQEARWLKVYNLTSQQYQAIYEAQGGVCAICRRATGATRALSVDHDHNCCKGRTSCGRCVRSLLCGPCNRFLGHIRDDPETIERMQQYLLRPPGQEVLHAWNSAQ